MSAAHPHTSSEAPPEPDRWSGYRPQFFSPADYGALEAFASIVIPTDETPGAREAHVAPFIDFVVFSAAEYSPQTQQQWRDAMGWLRARNFGNRSAEEQYKLVESMSKPDGEGFTVFQHMKDLIVYSYYTSRAGLVDNLNYKGLAYLTEFPACTHPEHAA